MAEQWEKEITSIPMGGKDIIHIIIVYIWIINICNILQTVYS